MIRRFILLLSEITPEIYFLELTIPSYTASMRLFYGLFSSAWKSLVTEKPKLSPHEPA